MSIEALMLVCTAILTAFGVLDSALRSFKMSRFAVIMFSLTMLALKQFTLSPVHEITINMAAAIMPFLFLCREKPKAFFLRGFFTVVYVAGLAGVRRIGIGVSEQIWIAVAASIAAASFNMKIRAGLLTASCAPLFASMAVSCAELVSSGYTTLEFGTVEIELQLTGIISVFLFTRMRALIVRLKTARV